MRRWPWDVLGIDPTHDESAVRKAYADALRALDLDKDVKAYADLRQARDEGLWLARRGEQQDDGDFGLGSFDDDDDFGNGVDLGFDPASVRFNESTPTPHEEGLDWSQLDSQDAGEGGYDAPPPEQPLAPELSEEEERARDAWNGMLAILYPEGQYSEEAITLAQMDEGNRYLASLIERSDLCGIEEHHALDHGLAQLMAETWPRSAPFVECAADAFHWLDESGQIEERPALMFLNLRLRGMRFHEKVQQPEHPLNKAWVELSRPGKSNLIDRWRVKREHVYQLLTGIRERYPEVESYLDDERVASWEYPQQSSGGGGLPWWIAIIVIVTVFRIASTSGGTDISGSDPLPLPTISSPKLDPSAFDARIEALFGEGVDFETVQQIDPVFADQLRNAMQTEGYGYMRIEGFVRTQAYRASSIAEFDELIALGELKRVWFAAAQQDNADVCRNVMAGDFQSRALLLDDAQAKREQTQLRKLLDAGVLNHLEGRSASNFSVPGWAIERVIQRSGLSEDQVAEALTNPGSDRRCLVESVLLGVVLEEPRRVSLDLLRAL